jgi:gamma-tubulin complex component 5
LLSLPATSLTLQFAETYLENINNPPMPPRPLTWQGILAEEPFEGQHWEGVYGLPPGSTVENWESRSNDSSLSLSPWDDVSEDQGEDSLSYAGSSRSVSDEDDDASVESDNKLKGQFAATKVVAQPYSHRDALEELKSRQYWRPEWRINADLSRPFSLGDPSTLGAG